MTDENKIVLCVCKILEKSNENAFLKEIDVNPDRSVQYHEENKSFDDIGKKLQELKNRFTAKRRKNKEDKEKRGIHKDCKDFSSFFEFLGWWCDFENKCHYCGISQSIAEKEVKDVDAQRPSWGKGTLQIDKKESKNGYNADNCVLACVFCNNAKSDLVKYEDFKKHFGKAREDYWKAEFGAK